MSRGLSVKSEIKGGYSPIAVGEMTTSMSFRSIFSHH